MSGRKHELLLVRPIEHEADADRFIHRFSLGVDLKSNAVEYLQKRTLLIGVFGRSDPRAAPSSIVHDLAVLASDPCSLLDPVSATQDARFAELAKDYDGQGGKTTDKSRCEARLALTLEAHGILTATVVRPQQGEAEDGDGQVWDFKGPHSREAIIHSIVTKDAIGGGSARSVAAGALRGEFDVKTTVQSAIGRQAQGKGVVFDLRRLTIDQARTLINVVATEPSINRSLVRYFPKTEDLVTLEHGGQGGV